MKMKAIHNSLGYKIDLLDRCVKLVKDNENESNSQLANRGSSLNVRCVKLVKDNENESNSQPSSRSSSRWVRCVKLVKDNENESNSQRFA